MLRIWKGIFVCTEISNIISICCVFSLDPAPISRRCQILVPFRVFRRFRGSIEFRKLTTKSTKHTKRDAIRQNQLALETLGFITVKFAPARNSAWFKSGLQLRGGWGQHPKGNAPRSEASAVRGLADCASSIPATQLSSPARLAERVVTPHAPRPNDVGGQPRFPGARKGVTLPDLEITGLATGPPAGVGDGLRFLSTR